MTDMSADVIDLVRVRARRLEQKARPVGIEVRVSDMRFALYGPDRGLYLCPRGVGSAIRWLTFDEAYDALERHIASPP